MEQFVRPINIPSPISGQPVVPRIIERDYGDKVVVEAHWIDPSSGAFIRKGIVEIREKKTLNESWPEEITPQLRRRVQRDEERSYREAGYRPGERNLAGMGQADPGQNYGIPSEREAPELYDDIEKAVGPGIKISLALQDYYAYNDADQGNLKSLYAYDVSRPATKRSIIEPIIDWIEKNR